MQLKNNIMKDITKVIFTFIILISGIVYYPFLYWDWLHPIISNRDVTTYSLELVIALPYIFLIIGFLLAFMFLFLITILIAFLWEISCFICGVESNIDWPKFPL